MVTDKNHETTAEIKGCNRCDGTGTEDCPICFGLGIEDGDDDGVGPCPCGYCDGSGKIPCPDCRGPGVGK